jgi:thiol-disulfide isomerase/thioredoxin
MSSAFGNEEKIEAFKNYVLSENVRGQVKAQYYYIYSTTAPETVFDEQTLIDHCDISFTFKKVDISRLADAFIKNNYKKKSDQATENLRLACIFYDRDDQPLLRLYVSSNGLIKVNDQLLSISPSLAKLITEPLPEDVQKDIRSYFPMGFFTVNEPQKDVGVPIEIILQPQTPSQRTMLLWSPPGRKLPLASVNGGLETSLALGIKGATEMEIRLERSPGNQYIDRLFIDKNRNLQFEDDELLLATLKEVQKQMWSCFETTVSASVLNPDNGIEISNPYQVSFGCISDKSEDSKQSLHFTSHSWMLGRGNFGKIDTYVMLVDMDLNGYFDAHDSWAIAPLRQGEKLTSLSETLYAPDAAKKVSEQLWLHNIAYRLVEIDPSGRRLTIGLGDHNAHGNEGDKKSKPASGTQLSQSNERVKFYRDYAMALQKAKLTKKPLLIDFETDWCGYCKKMDQFVYTDNSVVKAAKNVIAVKVDGDKNKPLVKQFQVNGYPTMILLSHDGKIIKKIVGYQDARQMVELLSVVN